MDTWKRYRFYTKEEDYRPIKFNPSFPWWCSGFAGDESYSVIIAFLPAKEVLTDYWPDAYEIDEQDVEDVSFSDRFPKPDYYVPLEAARSISGEEV